MTVFVDLAGIKVQLDGLATKDDIAALQTAIAALSVPANDLTPVLDAIAAVDAKIGTENA